MIEPTESESKAELDRLVNALISIRGEIRDIENGKADRVDNVLKNAPHPASEVLTDEWSHPYSRELVSLTAAPCHASGFCPGKYDYKSTTGAFAADAVGIFDGRWLAAYILDVCVAFVGQTLSNVGI